MPLSPTTFFSDGFRFRHSVLAAIPVIVVVSALFLNGIRGPFWASRCDPDYVYLTNALLIADGGKAFYADHPGAVMHLTNAAVILAAHRIWGKGPVARDVLAAPEKYLSACNLLLVLGYATVLFAAGCLAVGIRGNLSDGCLLQLTPFLSVASLRALTRVTPEPAMLTFSLLTGFFVLLLAEPDRLSRNRCLYIALGTGVAAGLGVASKITFLPLTIIPLLLLPGWVARIIFVASASLTFAVVTANPLVWTEWYFFRFMKEIICHTGLYGHGQEGIMSWPVLRANVLKWSKALLRDEWPLLAIVTVSVVLLIMSRREWMPGADRPATDPSGRRGHFRALAAVTLAQVAQLAMALKSPSATTRYLIPALGLTGTSLVLIRGTLPGPRTEAPLPGRLPKKVLLSVISAAVLAQALLLAFDISSFAARWHARLDLASRIKNEFPGKPVVYASNTSSVTAALKFGNDWARLSFSDTLSELYPRAVFFDMGQGTLCDFRENLDPGTFLQANPSILMQGARNSGILESPWFLPEIINRYECVLRSRPGLADQFEPEE